MPHKYNISRRDLQKRGLLSQEVFYKLLTEKCGYIDQKTAERFYLSLIKVVTQLLRTQGIARLPYMGDFAMVEQKSKTALLGGIRTVIPERKVLKFIPQERWKKYFNTLYNR